MAKKVKPIIKALAEWAVDDALDTHDLHSGKKRKRLPRDHYKKQLAKNTPARPQSRKGVKKDDR